MADVISGRVDSLTPEAARDLTDQIRVDLERVFELIKAAYQGRAWVALRYASWDDYITREFGNLHLRPPREKRQEVVRSLSEAGLSIRSISSATQLGDGTVRRALGRPSVPNGAPDDGSRVLGQDGKSYAASRPVRPVEPVGEEGDDAEVLDEPSPGPLSVDDVLDAPASMVGVEPLNLSERTGDDRERVSRMLREFHGSGSAALPMTIKLASQVAGVVSPLTGKAQVPGARLHELVYDVSRGVRVLCHVSMTLRESVASGESQAAIKANLRDARDELDRMLRQLEEAS